MAGLLNTDRPDPEEVTKVKTVVTNGPDGEMIEAPLEEATDVSHETEDPNEYDDDEEEPNVTDEEQMAYQQFVEASWELIYADGKVNEGIIAMLDEDPADLIAVLGELPELKDKFSPITALAATAAMVTLEVVRRTDPPPDDDIIFHGGRAILEDLAQLALTDFEQKDLNGALLMATSFYGAAAEQEGMIDKEVSSQAFADLLNAQEEGREDEIIPGASRFRDGNR